MPYVLRLAPEGWDKEKDNPLDDSAYEDNSVSAKAKRSAKGLGLSRKSMKSIYWVGIS